MAAAAGGAGDAGVPESASASPRLNALTSVTVVLVSGAKAAFSVSSQASSFEPGGTGIVVSPPPPPPQPESASSAAITPVADMDFQALN